MERKTWQSGGKGGVYVPLAFGDGGAHLSANNHNPVCPIREARGRLIEIGEDDLMSSDSIYTTDGKSRINTMLY